MSNKEDTLITVANTMTYGGSATTVIMGVSLFEWGVIIGIVTTVIGLVLGQYWQRRRDQREAEIMRATMDAIARGQSKTP